MIVIFYILLLMNIISFAVFFYDKEAAIWKAWRIKEDYLRTLAFAGSIGTYIAIKLLNHKTRKFKSDIVIIKMSAIAQVVFLITFRFI